MKFLTNNPSNLFKIEFWAATTIYVFLVFLQISDAIGINSVSGRVGPGSTNLPFNYIFVSRLLIYTILYGAFLLLNFKLVPRLVKRDDLLLNIFYIILVFLIIGLTYGFKDTYLKDYFRPDIRLNYNLAFQNALLYSLWLLILFGFYSAVKYFGISILSRADSIHNKHKFFTPEGLAVLTLWLISMFVLVLAKADRIAYASWGIGVPFTVLFYWFTFRYLIPRALVKKKPLFFYFTRTIVILFVVFFPVMLLAYVITGHDEEAATISLFNSLFQLMVMAPALWLLFRRQMRGNEEIYSLKRELGQSHANFDFLRSQINPHFLFNALNTIYGTAIQERAERTSEGVQKLGDMMRFMLQENMQEKISLSREIDYVNNYIALQKLRTDPNPVIKIESHIQEDVVPVQIAPMLLIPFVENAFKHGISFREPSHINISLEVKDKQLFFDVHNSKHVKQENDPEKNYTGIGLNNVRQRLQLLYPGRHELVIRETAKDFFIHLTIQLS